MITGLCAFVGMVIGALLVARRARRTAARAAAGEAVFFHVGANLPAEGRRRYSLGRVQTGGEFRWKPSRPWTRLRELPADLRYIRAREANFRESLWLPPRALVIECESSAGLIQLWAREEQATHVVEMIQRTSTPNSSSPVPDISS
ncbi:hypothetical protein ACIRPX_38215 [Streptomyces sp. NPDC101225]|uniref:hypothetical protein n=1 Tax=Streptomyces sp. NPDC101225 TaxID=3366135 RepID=UPI00382F1E04